MKGEAPMGDDWLEDAVKGAAGNISTYAEFEAECFSLFQKYSDNGYPDMVIVSLVCDATKMTMTIPTMFDKWRSSK